MERRMLNNLHRTKNSATQRKEERKNNFIGCVWENFFSQALGLGETMDWHQSSEQQGDADKTRISKSI